MTVHKGDPHYPAYHLALPNKAINDSCGATWWGDACL